ncbi:MAG: molybdopterin biosynthesis protein [Thermodesulfobacteriota bacterium]
MERKKRIYRNLTMLEEAGRILRERFGSLRVGSETIAVRDAQGRILTGSVKALASVPAYHAAAMDGIAVQAADTFGALPEKPVLLSRDAGRMVDTGNPLPECTDAVVMIEQVEERPSGWEIREAAYPWRNVRKAGEDMVKGEILVPARHRIGPYDQAALLAAGILSIEVYKKPRVLIIPTGDEIIRPEDAPSPLPKGALLEVNGQMLASLAAECGAESRIHKPVPNNPAELRDALRAALAEGYDLVMLIAGSSAGSEDFTPALLNEVGELLVHGITVMPGKPSLLAAAEGRPVVGIPGYPVSAAVAFRELARPLIYIMQGLAPPEFDRVEVTIGRKIPSKLGLEEHVRAVIGNVGGRLVAVPIAGGAGAITSIVRADGIIRIPQEVSGLSEGEKAHAELLAPRKAISDRLLAIGSHDMTIDLLSSLLQEKTGGRIRISSNNVGSLGGLLALKRQTAHMAGSHLLDTATGDYNLAYIDRYLQGIPVALVTLVRRWQGFMTPAGNPKRITGIGDLSRTDIVFVNRQSGSGTRVLLDYELARAGIAPERINGYGCEEYTHMNIAMAVASGAADTGLGIHAAAQALSLDFVPVTKERYDLVIPRAYLDDEKIQLLLELIRSDAFKEKTLELGGYDVQETGRLVCPP